MASFHAIITTHLFVIIIIRENKKNQLKQLEPELKQSLCINLEYYIHKLEFGWATVRTRWDNEA